MKIVNMLNELYTAFDVLTDPKKNPNVYKVIKLIFVIVSWEADCYILCRV